MDNELFEKIDKGLKRATLNAILGHKNQGNPICVIREGKIVRVKPEDIDVSLYEEKKSMLICGPKVEDHPSIGFKCKACGIKFKAGDYTALAVDYPASQEDVKRMMKGLDYNACAQEIHKECYESYKNNAK